jgi:hypothetical protein
MQTPRSNKQLRIAVTLAVVFGAMFFVVFR